MTTKPRPSGTFASKTKVKPEKTRQEVEALLRANKAVRIVTMDEPGFFVVGFVMGERWFRVEVAVERGASDQIRRARWRALLLVIKAKLEAVAQRISSIEDEFLSATVMPTGRP